GPPKRIHGLICEDSERPGNEILSLVSTFVKGFWWLPIERTDSFPRQKPSTHYYTMTLSRRDVFFLLFSMSLLFLMRGSIRALTEFAANWDNEGSQIFLIPFISATLVYLNRRKIFCNVGYSVIAGGTTMIVGLGLLSSERALGANLTNGDRLGLM